VSYKPDDPFAHCEENYEIDLLKLGGLYGFYACRDQVDVNLATASFRNYRRSREMPVPGLDEPGPDREALGSQFFSGRSKQACALELTISRLLNKQQTQIVATGNMVHQAVLPSLLTPHTVVLMDEQNGPAFWDALGAHKGEIKTYAHNDTRELGRLLAEFQEKRKIIVTESAFSLLGDFANLREIADLSKRYQARLFVDESNTFGLIGEQGTGLCAQWELSDHVDVIAASTIPGLGIDCGFFSAERSVIEYVKHQSAAIVFGLGVRAHTLTALTEALDSMHLTVALRKDLRRKAEDLAQRLMRVGLHVIHHDLPIVSVVAGHPMMDYAIQRLLLNERVLVSVVGPPMVAPEMTLLRLNISELTTCEQLDEVVEKLERVNAEGHQQFTKLHS
jgi:8-amino-7-oxononanoate synthase